MTSLQDLIFNERLKTRIQGIFYKYLDMSNPLLISYFIDGIDEKNHFSALKCNMTKKNERKCLSDCDNKNKDDGLSTR